MNLNVNQIRSLLAPVYRDACLNGDVDMKLMAELLEYLAELFKGEYPHSFWQRLNIEEKKYNTPSYREILIRLKQEYFVKLAEAIEKKILELCAEDRDKAFDVWLQEYIDALVHWDSIVYTHLCAVSFGFDDVAEQQIRKYQKLNSLIFDERWTRVYPFYCELAENTDLALNYRSQFAIYAGQVELYHVLPDYDKAFEHIQEAKKLHPGAAAERALGEYYLRIQDYDKAREYFMNTLSMDPADINNYLYMGDSYREEMEYSIAEQWYNDALHLNFLEPFVYHRLILLHGFLANSDEKNDNMARPVNHHQQIERLVNYAESIEVDHPDENYLYNLYRNAGYAYSLSRYYSESRRYYHKAIDGYPNQIQAYLDLGYILTYEERYEEALERFNKAAQLGDPSFEACWGLALVYEKMEKYDDAINSYERCLELQPAREEKIKYHLGYMFEKSGECEKAENCYRDLVKKYPDKQKYVESLKKMLEENSKTEELETLLTDLVVADPYNPLHHNDLGGFYFDHQQFEKAIPNYMRAIDLNDGEPVFWENLGLAYEKTGQSQEAEETYMKASDLDKQSGRYYNRLGIFYNSISEHSKSISCYKKALEREEGNILFMNNLGIGYALQGDLYEAERQFQNVLRSDPENVTAHTELGLVLIKLNRYEEAKDHLEKSIKLEPTNVRIYGNIGFLYQEWGEYDRALQTYLKALEMEPDNDFYHNQIGVMHYWLGNFKEAKTHYHRAIQKNPGVPLYYSNLGLVLNDLSETEAAKEAYAKSEALTLKAQSEEKELLKQSAKN